ASSVAASLPAAPKLREGGCEARACSAPKTTLRLTSPTGRRLHSSHSHRQRPNDAPLFLSPSRTQFRFNFFQRIPLFCRHKSLRRRPRPQIAEQFLHAPFRRHLELRRRDFREWERQLFEFFHQDPFSRPIRSNNVG